MSARHNRIVLLRFGLLEHAGEALLDLVDLGQQDGDRLGHQLLRVVLADRLDLVCLVSVPFDRHMGWIHSQMKWSLILLSWTRSANSGCRRTSRLTVSFRGFLITHCGSPFSSSSMATTPGAKHETNLAWCSRGIGPRS